jgi:hypothetical protein
LVENPLAPFRTETYTEYLGPYEPTGATMVFREIRTESYTYAEYEDGYHEFYDLSVDPMQLLNRVDNPIYAEVISGLQKTLQILMEQ